MREISEDISITPFEDLVSAKLAELSGGEKLTPLGAITYDGGRRTILIGSDVTNGVRGFGLSSDEISDLLKIDNHGRVIDMNSFDVVNAVQVDGVHYETEETIEDGNRVGINCTMRAGNTTRVGKIEPQEIIDTLLGRKGGVILFEGHNLQEAPALVLEEDAGEERRADILFFQEDHLRLSGSLLTEGFTWFLIRLNRELMLKYYGPELGEYVQRLQQAQILHPSRFFVELFRSKVLAAVADIHYNNDSQSRDYLTNVFPKRKLLQRGPDLLDIHEFSRKVGVAEPPKPVEPEPEPETEVPEETADSEDIYGNLETSRYRKLRLSVEDSFGLIGSKVMDAYVDILIDDIDRCSRLSQIDDILALINELKTTDLYSTHVRWKYKSRYYDGITYIDWVAENASMKRFHIMNSSS